MIRNLTWERAAETYTRGYPSALAATSVPMPKLLNATVASVHDGDTFTATADRLNDDYSVWQIRLLGCNAIELAQPGGKEARDNLAALLPVGTPIVLQTIGNDKYAPRKDCAVTLLLNGVPTDLVAYLCQQQWAAPWTGVGKAPVPPWPRTVA